MRIKVVRGVSLKILFLVFNSWSVITIASRGTVAGLLQKVKLP